MALGRMYEDLKGELGLDHFEGRSFMGWTITSPSSSAATPSSSPSESALFPPSTRRQDRDDSLEIAA